MSDLLDVLEHNSWATTSLIEFCRALQEDQLQTTAPGTYGSIASTLGHIVGSEEYYFFLHSGVRPESELTPDRQPGLDELAMRAAKLGDEWAVAAAGYLDLKSTVERRRGDGTVQIWTRSLVLVQVLHHAGEHRSQVGTILGQLNIEPPPLDAGTYARLTGRLHS